MVEEKYVSKKNYKESSQVQYSGEFAKLTLEQARQAGLEAGLALKLI